MRHLDGYERVLRREITDRWGRPLLLGIGGDQTQHLLWRIENGELTSALRARSDVLFSLHVGTNNLDHARPSEVATGVLAVAEWLLNNTRGKTSVTAILPRAPKSQREFLADVEAANAGVRTGVRRFASRRVLFARCGGTFARANQTAWRADQTAGMFIDRKMLPDGLHPSTDGFALLLPCWARALGCLDGTQPCYAPMSGSML